MALRVPELEFSLGIEVYASKTEGIGGRIRCSPEEFVVEEILVDGSKASVCLDNIKALTSGHGRYLVCVMIKKGWDTFSAIRQVAAQLGVQPERIRIAGIKDAHALTAQHISIGSMPPQKVLGFKLEGLRIIPVRFMSEKLSSRLIYGNEFNIVVRDIECSLEIAQSRIQETKSELNNLGGVPNFFGHQRFGTVRPVTHEVGRLLVKQDFEGAAAVFLSKPSPHEHPKARRARRRLQETGDYERCLAILPRMFVYERAMLRYLSKRSSDYLGAFRRLPRHLRRFFVQAYQSYLFNKFLSERMKQGIPLRKAQTGDYVVELDEKGLPTERFERAEANNVLEINKKIASGRMTIALPLIGFKQRPSSGLQGEIEKAILEQEEVNPSDFQLEKMPEASAAGGLRTALTPVLNLDVEPGDPCANHECSSVRFRFMLHKGSYATVVLREFMKPKDLIASGF